MGGGGKWHRGHRPAGVLHPRGGGGSTRHRRSSVASDLEAATPAAVYPPLGTGLLGAGTGSGQFLVRSARVVLRLRSSPLCRFLLNVWNCSQAAKITGALLGSVAALPRYLRNAARG